MAATLAILGSAGLRADQASAFFDDTTIKEVRITFADSNWYNTLFNSHRSDANDPYFPAAFESAGVSIPQIGIRFKGNSSFNRNGVKKPFKIDFNEYDDDATFYGLKKLNLHNGDLQPDFMHEKLFHEFAGKYIAAMRSTYVRLYINGAYYGLYQAVEQPDKTMMQSRFGDNEDGNLYEAGESAAATMAYLGAAAASYSRAYELKTNEEANDYSGLISMLDILNNTATAELPAKLDAVMDVESVLHAMALNTLFTNLESYVGTASEYFLYQRSSDKRFVHIHWDLNETFGSTGDGTPRLTNPFQMDMFYLPTAGTGGPGGGAGGTARPLLTKLWAVDAYKRAYLQMLAKYLREGFDEASFAARSTTLANLIRADYTADPNKAYTMAQFETALTNQVTANNFTTYGITQFVRERAAYLKPLLQAMASQADVRLNEVVTVNSGAQRDEAGDADAWVEIHNLGPGSVSTSGMYLTDDTANPTKWALPERTLADGEHLVIWLDGETSEGAAHASFKPAAAGKLALYATSVSASTPVDSVTYSAMSAGQGYARVGMIGANWSLTSALTPGAANTIKAVTTGGTGAGTGQLLINEIMADNDGAYADPDESGAYEDWFEVYNPGTAAVDMSGMYITDSLSNHTKWQVPSGVTIPAKGYLVFTADGETAQGARHASWSLSKDGESISIYASDGTTLIDTYSFGPQRTDVAVGRTTDGVQTWSLFAKPTPGAANASALANWITNGAGYQLAPVAPGSIAAVFGSSLAGSATAASSTTLPTTLGGVTVSLTDSAGTARNAGLFFVAPSQINFEVPAGTAEGVARVSVQRSGASAVTGDILIAKTAGGLFSAAATGQGVGLLSAVRVSNTGTQTPLTAFRYDSATQSIVAVPLSLGASTDGVYLTLYTTGVRNVANLSNVTMTVGGETVPVTFAAAQSEYPGLDQINAGPLPRTLAGKGDVAVIVTVDGNRSNTVRVSIE